MDARFPAKLPIRSPSPIRIPSPAAVLTPLDTDSYAPTYCATLATPRGGGGGGGRRFRFVKRATAEEAIAEVAAARAAHRFGLAKHALPVQVATLDDGSPVVVAPWVAALVPLHQAGRGRALAAVRDGLDGERRWRLLLWSFLIGDCDRRPENYGLPASSSPAHLLAFDANWAYNGRVAWYDTDKCALAELAVGREGLRGTDAIPAPLLQFAAGTAGAWVVRDGERLNVRNTAALRARYQMLQTLARRRASRTTVADLRACCADQDVFAQAAGDGGMMR